MTDQVSSSPEPNYPWTRYHRSQEQTTCDPDHWNLTTRSRSISPEDRDPNDDPFTRHTYIDSDANHLVENKIPIPIPPCILVKDLRITEEPPCYNWYIHGQQVGPQPAIFLLQNWLLPFTELAIISRKSYWKQFDRGISLLTTKSFGKINSRLPHGKWTIFTTPRNRSRFDSSSSS